MKMTVSNVNKFLFFKLPAAFWCGVRLKQIDKQTAVTTVKHKWVNQNPFRSMYFAVQLMAAELSTAVLVMQQIELSGHKVSMLVLNNNSSYNKKATGKIKFTCTQGDLVVNAIKQAIETKQGITLWLESIGTNQDGIEVSRMNFEWTLLVKN